MEIFDIMELVVAYNRALW